MIRTLIRVMSILERRVYFRYTPIDVYIYHGNAYYPSDNEECIICRMLRSGRCSGRKHHNEPLRSVHFLSLKSNSF